MQPDSTPKLVFCVLFTIDICTDLSRILLAFFQYLDLCKFVGFERKVHLGAVPKGKETPSSKAEKFNKIKA
jgi:hypothetical protein